MSNIEKLKEWGVKESKNGLIHIWFFPGCNKNVDSELAAGDALALVNGDNVCDITDKVL